MANHKRGRAKNQRAGCLLCKPHKANGAKNKSPTYVRRRESGERADALTQDESFEQIQREIDAMP